MINEDDLIDVGGDHMVRLMEDQDGNINSLIITHPHAEKEGEFCEGYVLLGKDHKDKYTWQLRSVDPLDVSPSFDCDQCSDHGNIIKGEWRPTKIRKFMGFAELKVRFKRWLKSSSPKA